jgi:Domain of unknown function (DUF4919)
MKNITPLALLVSLLLPTFVFAQDIKILTPNYNDKYSKYVNQLEAGDLNIDYTDFRNSFVESKQFRRKGGNYDSLKKQVFSEIKNKNYSEVITLTKEMLSIDYTSMFAHKYLQQSYKILGDTINQKKYHEIEFGLLNSIIKSGDGKTCETGWHVTQIEEEYFILNIIGVQVKSQNISTSGQNACDKMIVSTENGEQTYYFEANLVFKAEEKSLGK